MAGAPPSSGPQSAPPASPPSAHGAAPRRHRHWNEPDVRRHLWDDQPVALETVHEIVAASRASFTADGCGMWVLESAAGFTGMCGLRATDGGEAGAVLRHAFTALDLPRVLGGVDDANHASRRVLEKLGMTPLAAPDGAPPGVGWLAISRERWRATSA